MTTFNDLLNQADRTARQGNGEGLWRWSSCRIEPEHADANWTAPPMAERPAEAVPI
jgi:hypothetical protein